jgi:hypothetical protein
MKQERQFTDDFIDRQLKQMRRDADATQRDTNRALDRLNQVQSDLEMKNRNNQAHTGQFFNDLMVDTKASMAQRTYNSPL